MLKIVILFTLLSLVLTSLGIHLVFPSTIKVTVTRAIGVALAIIGAVMFVGVGNAVITAVLAILA